MAAENFKITGMTCTECTTTIKRAVKKIPGVKKANVNLSMESMVIDKDPSVTDKQIIDTIKKVGYGATPVPAGESLFSTKMSKTLKMFIIKTVLAAIFTIPLWIGMILMAAKVDTTGAKVIYGPIFGLVMSIIVLAIGYQFFIDAWTGLTHGVGNMSTLIVIGSLASLGLSIYNSVKGGWLPSDMDVHKYPLYYETIGTIVTLVLLGKVFENVARKSTTSSLKKISELVPNQTTILVDGKEQKVNSSAIKINDIVIVKTGDKIPTDGIIISGTGYTNESLISGESKPVSKKVNDKVIAGSVLTQGVIQFKATKTVSDNTVSTIINLVSEAQTNDMPIGRLVDKISNWFVPVVIAIAIIVLLAFGFTTNWSDAFVRAISVLVVACPCALGLAVPTAIMVGTGKASEAGIIFKNGNQLENLAKLKAVVFDKTGTLTDGKMTLDKIINLSKDIKDETIKEYLKSVESNSQHPIAVSLVNSLKDTKNVESTYFENNTSKGVQGVVNGKVIKIGSANWLTNDKDIIKQVNTLQSEGKTVFIMTVENKPAAIISLADHIKDDAKELIKSLNALGIKTVMVTGDNANTANYVAKQLGIKEVHSEIPVTEKANFVAALQDGGKNRFGKQIHNVVAMVGDGINDTVALTKADIGITMSTSLDAAIASSDIILARNKLIDIYYAVIASKRSYNKIISNLFWAFIYNVVMIPIVIAVGSFEPDYSAIAMALSSITVVLNSLLLKAENIHKKPIDWFGWLYERKTKVSADEYDKKIKSVK